MKNKGDITVKKVLGILTTTALVATLAACSNGDNGQNNQANNAGQNNENQANQSQSNNNNSNGNNQSNNQNNGNTNQTKQKNLSVEEAVQNLTDEERVALALYEQGIDKVSVTANDFANGQLTRTTWNGPEVKSFNQLTLTPESLRMMPEAPSDLRLYKPYPTKVDSAVSLVAVRDDQVILYVTQYGPSYSELLSESDSNRGKVFSVKDLYSKYSNQDYKGLASRIVIGPEPPEAKAPQTSSSDSSDSDESESSSSSSSTSGTTVTRANVIDLVEDYEGHLLDTDTYTYKEPAQLDDGSWGFSFLDKSGNLAGSYIVSKDGTVTKYDEKGIEE